ncbi:hypothetical protein B0H11DRAFT_1934788 [Mycena galericulata]|nr:hypothetical protein B0H11DRAFT_1934788 [Mycena galericulata]
MHSLTVNSNDDKMIYWEESTAWPFEDGEEDLHTLTTDKKCIFSAARRGENKRGTRYLHKYIGRLACPLPVSNRGGHLFMRPPPEATNRAVRTRARSHPYPPPAAPKTPTHYEIWRSRHCLPGGVFSQGHDRSPVPAPPHPTPPSSSIASGSFSSSSRARPPPYLSFLPPHLPLIPPSPTYYLLRFPPSSPLPPLPSFRFHLPAPPSVIPKKGCGSDDSWRFENKGE